jgi:hypothetical protein
MLPEAMFVRNSDGKQVRRLPDVIEIVSVLLSDPEADLWSSDHPGMLPAACTDCTGWDWVAAEDLRSGTSKVFVEGVP